MSRAGSILLIALVACQVTLAGGRFTTVMVTCFGDDGHIALELTHETCRRTQAEQDAHKHDPSRPWIGESGDCVDLLFQSPQVTVSAERSGRICHRAATPSALGLMATIGASRSDISGFMASQAAGLLTTRGELASLRTVVLTV